MPPARFIPIAEQSGLIVTLGDWVLRRACAQAAAWSDVDLSVNLSPFQFRNRGLAAEIGEILRATGLPGSRLELEVTESVLLHDTDQALAILTALKELGIRLAMDDFGTGYSSLSYLQRFPFDNIKIDQSFVRDLFVSGDSAAIIRAVISLGRSLGVGDRCRRGGDRGPAGLPARRGLPDRSGLSLV